MQSLILTTTTRLLAALLLMFSVYALLRGHNLPGGGFIGGLIGATAFILYTIATSVEEAQAALRIDPSNLAMAGLGVAALGGIGAAFAGQPFFTGQWLFLFRDGDSYVPLSTVLVFDIGVYMAVFGGILTLVFALEQEI
ncbi:MAG: Na+/H+ antiporter subunit B [Bradyrhizobium sp.]|jgi:multicomponent Na+:H+ antiporter subunit B|uniref:Na+/H+ antiporter subunit B n=1 Tax=Paracoccus marcusii TaxID=59779 RepID=A0ABY7URR1_9RHOB|nr:MULTISPECIES: Na+/H+ antiporter subunit B [Paracoccus]MCP4617941.1 Na+/H+ antiporter subunit B [Bradyrhizobium sp.]TYP63027.1 multisubunit sodium/proton antiporter MrpB subunit [Stutzerimonas stutzeri]AZY94478.1 Na+/H+ antiporter subunit B [Paracoccus sp. Arc7-R13]KIX18711.1 monovalent cation/H+ antiporter subunit B [Paracoccus sp. 228]MBF5078643.1 Na+/H+ antiporter subunit B [Paracoccus sp. NBH48]|tara:strand:+ start:2991 stop:3407 length:417 start_codon:yes stop_codon:yes gene_type:complete